MTSRWVVDITPHRDLNVTWRPISLLIKNQTPPDSPFYERVVHTRGLLRVMESVRAAEGAAAVGELYRAYGEHIHHARNPLVAAATALAHANLPVSHADAADDESWDATIRASMDDGLGLAGTDVGTPLMAFTPPVGERVGFFGPVISRRLPLDEGLRLWDGLVLAAGTAGFWEFKRTRTESPNFTPVG